ncbi:YycH family regulatory protein [Paenibacillus sp. FSL W7-1287]|uniref:YycH family regulatory protein n=1 Tax=Paenibacillus sp. FSL W7-1287 TaxID=2954538 RepID=UPI0030F722FC
MIERAKTGILILLVALSLVQTYFLAYRMPWLGTTTRSDQDYVNTELLGQGSNVEQVVFPEELILHLGSDEHAMIYPNTQFYELIVRQRLASREFKGFQVLVNPGLNWEEIRREHKGIELSFTKGISFELLKKLMKLDTEGGVQDSVMLSGVLIFAQEESEEVLAYFFDQNGSTVYQALHVDLTVKDIGDYIGFGQYLPRFTYMHGQLYVANEPIQATEYLYSYEVFTPEQMQRSLFFDSSTTRAIVNRSGSQIYTDGKRGLKVEQNGLWISYTNSVASQSSSAAFNENVYLAVDFVNQHGGWDTTYQLVNIPTVEERYVRFRKYIDQYPVIDISPFHYGYVHLGVQQGVVVEYERSLIKLPQQEERKEIRWLYGGNLLQNQLETYGRTDEIVTIYPALKVVPQQEQRIEFLPVWAVLLEDGSEEVLMDAMPAGYEPKHTVTTEMKKETEDQEQQEKQEQEQQQ